MSKTKAHFSAQKAAFPQAQLPAQALPTPIAPVPLSAPAPFQFAPRSATVQPYVTPERMAGSGTGAQNVFASQRGFDPVQSFLSSLPELGSTTPWQNNMTLPPEAFQPAPVAAAPAVTPAEQMGTQHPLYQAILRKYGGGV